MNKEINESHQSSLTKWSQSFWPIAKGFFAIVSALGTILALIQWWQYTNSDPKVKFSIIDNQCLTSVHSIPGLECMFSFSGKQVNGLWMSKISMENVCRKNIIGVPGGDLMFSNICFKIAPKYKIVSAVVDGGQLAADLSCDSQSFNFAFEKWSPKQTLVIKVFCEQIESSANVSFPNYSLAYDPFKQGEFEFVEYSTAAPASNLLSRYPVFLGTFLKWLGVILYGVVFVLCTWGLFIKMSWVGFIRRLVWCKRYYRQSADLIKTSDKESSSIAQIDGKPPEFWEKLNIPVPPTKSAFVKYDKVDWQELFPILLLIFVGYAFSFVALSALIEF